MPGRRAPAPRRALAAIAGLTLVATLAGTTAAAPGGNLNAGFKTEVPAMLMEGADAPDGVVIDPIISVGDRLNSGFMFEFDPGRDLVHAIRTGSSGPLRQP